MPKRIGSVGGAYSTYSALLNACGRRADDFKPDYAGTEPVYTPAKQASWDDGRIVTFDPYGFESEERTMAITRALLTIAEISTLKRDGKIVLENGQIVTTKIAVDSMWNLPGLARRLSISETMLRQKLFETLPIGGLLDPGRHEFYPPIGGMTVYMFGDPAALQDPTTKVTVRPHDECNGSDVFGSDICTCRPYLMYGVEQCVETAQGGGVGILVYFRKEGRALGEVTKYLVYNARKRQEGGDRSSEYFERTRSVAGVEDARFQELMPDILHWLGIQRIDALISMSNDKYDAIVAAGIGVVDRVALPRSMIPSGATIEIDAKINEGYLQCTEPTVPVLTYP